MRYFQPKIYVICMSAYKNGVLHGAWMNANQDVNALYAEVQAMLANSPMYDAELFEIYDYEDFDDLYLDKNITLEMASSLASLVVANQGQHLLSSMCINQDASWLSLKVGRCV